MPVKSARAAAASYWAEYWHESRRPLINLVFVSPMLLVYEGGLLALGPQSLRNGADVWLRRLLEGIGFSQYFLLPLLTCGILLAWHHVQRDDWSIRWSAMSGMLVESMIIGVLLVAAAQWQKFLFDESYRGTLLTTSAAARHGFAGIVAFLGAGIYEELLFRLMLLPVLIGILRMVGASRAISLSGAVVLGSVLFAAAHYRFAWYATNLPWDSTAGEPFALHGFVFRILAGSVFSLLFLYRGFGVAAGSHALYDILVAV